MAEKTLKDLKPGDYVEVIGRVGTHLDKVAKVYKRFFTLTNGDRYGFDGYSRPRDPWYYTEVRPAGRERVAEGLRTENARRLKSKLSAWLSEVDERRDLPTLRAMWKLVSGQTEGDKR